MGIIAMAKDNYFILGGIDSRDYDMIVSCKDAFVMPKRDIDTFEVPGRNGELIVDNGRFKNVDIVYQVVIEKDFAEKVNAFKREVGKLRGYVRLEDTFDFDVYRMANVQDIKIDELGMRYNGGTFEIKVNCKPQKFLKSGEDEIPAWFPIVTKKEVSGAEYDEMHSGNFKFWGYIEKTIYLTVHCPQDVTVTVEWNSLDQSTDVIGTQTQECTNGETVQMTFAVLAVYGNIILKADDITGVFAAMECMLISADDYDISTPCRIQMVDELVLNNLTGYATRPLFRFSGLAVTDINIINYVNGEVSETYRVKCLEDTAGTVTTYDEAFLDCDLMYMYAGTGANISNRLRITTATDKSGRNLVFPEFGTDVIKITSLATLHSGMNPEWLPVMYITPRWWTV